MPSLLIPQQSNTRDFFHNIMIMQCAKPVWPTPDFARLANQACKPLSAGYKMIEAQT